MGTECNLHSFHESKYSMKKQFKKIIRTNKQSIPILLLVSLRSLAIFRSSLRISRGSCLGALHGSNCALRHLAIASFVTSENRSMETQSREHLVVCCLECFFIKPVTPQRFF